MTLKRKCPAFHGGILFSILFFLFAGIVNSEVEPTPTPKQDMELAKFDGKILKMDEFIEGLSFRSGYRFKEMGEERIANMDPKELENLAQDYLFSEKMAEIAEKEGFADDPKVKDQMESIKQRILANLIYKKEVMDKVPEASEDECKQYYEDNKKEKYGRPFSFKMRHIFLSTYLPYVAVKGDTLEGIAEKICKDKGKVEYILKDDETKDPRYVKPEEREEKPFRALEPGEKILVPMSDADKMAVYEKTKAIHEDLKKGADFSLLAKKHSETGANKGDVIGPIMPDKDQKPMLPEIIAAVKKTEAGKFSEIVQTKHGYNIIKVEEKNDEGFIPYDQIQRTIQSTLTGERRLQESKKFLLKIAENAKGIIVNKGAFDAADHSPDSVIVEIGDKVKFTLADYDEFVPEPVRKKAETSDDKIVAILESRKVILPLLTLYAENQKLDQSEEFKSEFRHRKIMILSDQYLRKLKEDLPPPTEEEMREYYDKNLDRYKDPQKYDLSVIGRKIKDYGQKMPEEEENKLVVKLTQELNEIRKKIKTREEFEKMAREISEDPTSRNGGAIGFVPLSYRNGFGGKLEKMKAGDISEPFVYINFVYLLMVNDMIPEKIRPFEEAKNSVERDYSAMKHQEFDKNKREEILKAGGFEFLKK